jgi:translation initiation factor eIF-2B subunit delta
MSGIRYLCTEEHTGMFFVQSCLADMQQGKDFKVLVVDARPDISGEKMACTLLSAGIKCSHMALDALTHMIKDATKVMLGASAVKSNGAAVARAGSALVAMASANARKPVLICAQSIKFHDEVQLESITSNEQGDPMVRPPFD